MVAAFHGINAYSGKAGIIGLIRKAQGAEVSGPAEICCSDRPIGTVGVLLHGVCNRFYTADAYTEIDHDGSRYVDSRNRLRATGYDRDWYKLFTGQECEPFDAKYISQQPTTGRYKEILLTDTEACAVWYSKPGREKTARVIGRALGLPVVRVSKDSSFLSWQI